MASSTSKRYLSELGISSDSNTSLEKRCDSSSFSSDNSDLDITELNKYGSDSSIQGLISKGKFYNGMNEYNNLFIPSYNVSRSYGVNTEAPSTKDEYQLLANNSIDFLIDYQHRIVDGKILMFGKKTKEETESMFFDLVYNRILSKAKSSLEKGEEFVPEEHESILLYYATALMITDAKGKNLDLSKFHEYKELYGVLNNFSEKNKFDIAGCFKYLNAAFIDSAYSRQNKICPDKDISIKKSDY